MKNVKLCAHRIERYKEGTKQVDRIACVEDYLLALATYSAACRRWADAHMSLRQGKPLIEYNRQKPAWPRPQLQLHARWSRYSAKFVAETGDEADIQRMAWRDACRSAVRRWPA